MLRRALERLAYFVVLRLALPAEFRGPSLGAAVEAVSAAGGGVG